MTYILLTIIFQLGKVRRVCWDLDSKLMGKLYTLNFSFTFWNELCPLYIYENNKAPDKEMAQ